MFLESNLTALSNYTSNLEYSEFLSECQITRIRRICNGICRENAFMTQQLSLKVFCKMIRFLVYIIDTSNFMIFRQSIFEKNRYQ